MRIGDARKLGDNVIIGIDIYYEVLGESNNILRVTASANEVVVE